MKTIKERIFHSWILLTFLVVAQCGVLFIVSRNFTSNNGWTVAIITLIVLKCLTLLHIIQLYDDRKNWNVIFGIDLWESNNLYADWKEQNESQVMKTIKQLHHTALLLRSNHWRKQRYYNALSVAKSYGYKINITK